MDFWFHVPCFGKSLDFREIELVDEPSVKRGSIKFFEIEIFGFIHFQKQPSSQPSSKHLEKTKSPVFKA